MRSTSGKLAHVSVAAFVAEHLAYQSQGDLDLAGRATTFNWCAHW
ncbi:hypothetical protein [Kocuria atrinae]